jgi:succinate-semialdehyde dehydrogenase/glutarate-semialdehyde dehydrogenase
MAIQSVNPTNGKKLKRFKALPWSGIDAALTTAEGAVAAWRTLPIEQRGKLILRAGKTLRDRKRHYAELITLEMGKPIGQAVGEVEKCAWACEYFARNAAGLLADEIVKTEARKSYVRFAPLGVVCAVMPWNFPFWQVFRFAAPALPGWWSSTIS